MKILGCKFDMKVIRNNLCIVLFDREIEIVSVIKKDGSYVLLATPNVVFKGTSTHRAALRSIVDL